MAFQGSCHCGAVKFSVDAEMPTEVMECNCSICRRKGVLMAFYPVAKVKVEGEAALQAYKFNKHVLSHWFCKTCGIHTFGGGKGPDGNEMRAINMRCVPDAKLGSLKIQHFDGASV
ncbi:MAG TPA: GFA family protein [Reyranella sp.]|nr:GFA family protein [Reyranella sp.]